MRADIHQPMPDFNDPEWQALNMTAVPSRPTAPDAMAGDGLLASALADGLDGLTLWGGRILPRWWAEQIADALLDGPLRDVLAAAARDAEKVRRVEELFAGGPDTPCRTTWREDESMPNCSAASIECCEVPMDELRAALDAP